MKFSSVTAIVLLSLTSADAFAPILTQFTRSGHTGLVHVANQNESALHMAKGGKKKRRRRKNPPPSADSASEPTPSQQDLDAQFIPEGSSAASGEDLPSIDELRSIASFSASSSTPTQKKMSIDEAVPSTKLTPVGDGYIESTDDNTLVELPDIRNVLKNKELKKLEEEEQEKKARPKISRKDRKAMLQVSTPHDGNRNVV
jgi:hypothetical protein